jgi:sigma-54 dependent transcriptional regulator, acetoin dehydrogenase operon transcriptional activator AcoR
MESLDFVKKYKEANETQLKNQEKIYCAEFSEKIALSLKRSKLYGVDPEANTLPPTSNKDIKLTIQSIPIYGKLILNESRDYYDNIDLVFEAMGAVILYLNSDLLVFNKFGDKALLEELKRKNISFGTDFNECRVGTNAVSLAKELNTVCWLLGNENFCRALSGYVCCGYVSAIEQFDMCAYTLIIFSEQAFNEKAAVLTNFFCRIDCIIYGYNKIPHESVFSKLFDSYMKQENLIYMIVDEKANIFFANEGVVEICGSLPGEILGNKVDQIFPELKSVINELKFNNNVRTSEIIFPTLNEGSRTYLVNTTPAIINELEKKYVITLQNKTKLSYKMQNLLNQGAYYTIDDIKGNSENIIELKKQIRRYANSASNVLITGESGTGKELIAQSIHNTGPRHNKPFVSVNCSALPKELIASELFGYVEGAFTGARKGGAPGKFELANGGTLFLDEIGDMPMDMQAILLRVLEERTITPLGGAHPKKIDVRIIAATNKDLKVCAEAKEFRFDLYYRLNVIRIESIPLRHLKSDIPVLAQQFLNDLFITYPRKNVLSITSQVMDTLCEYSWPGNVRELHNLIERLVNNANPEDTYIDTLPYDFTELVYQSNREYSDRSIKEIIGNMEKQQIIALLNEYHGRKSDVAKALGISRQTLYTKMKKFGIDFTNNANQ